MKSCLFCKYLCYLEGDVGYSERTPGHTANISCSFEKWSWDQFRDMEEDFRFKLLTATECSDFELTDLPWLTEEQKAKLFE